MPKSRIALLNYEAHMQCTCNGQLRCIHCNKQFAFRSFAGHFMSHKPVLSACQCVPWPVSLRAATRTRPAAVLCQYLNSLLLSWLWSEATELASLMRDEVNKFKGNVCRHKCVFATCASRQSVHGLRAAAALASPARNILTGSNSSAQALLCSTGTPVAASPYFQCFRSDIPRGLCRTRTTGGGARMESAPRKYTATSTSDFSGAASGSLLPPGANESRTRKGGSPIRPRKWSSSTLVVRQADALSYLHLDVGYLLMKTTMKPRLESETEATLGR